MVYNLVVSEKKKQVLALFLVPLAYMLLITTLMLCVPSMPGLEAWLLMICSLLASLLTTVYIFTRQLSVPCEVKVTGQGIFLRFHRRSIFYFRRERFISWSYVSATQDEFLHDTGNVSVWTSHPASCWLFSALPGELQGLSSFFSSVKVYASMHSRKGEISAWRQGNFFGSRIAKIAAVIFLAGILAFTGWLLWQPTERGTYAYLRLTYLYLLALPFLYKVVKKMH